MRSTYTKPNSHTQQQATRAVGIRECAIHSSNLTRDEWISLFFEIGCLYAENLYKGEAIHYLNGEIGGYWDWWNTLWIDDDEVLLQHYGSNIRNYSSLKYDLLK